MKDVCFQNGENFNTNHNCPGDDVFVFWVCLDPVVECNGVQDEQELSLVLVDPFGLDVENGARVQPKTRFLLPVVGELYLVLDFDLKKKSI